MTDRPHVPSGAVNKCHFDTVEQQVVMGDNNDAFVVLEPQNEGEAPSASGKAPQLPQRPAQTDKPNFLVITADSMC